MSKIDELTTEQVLQIQKDLMAEKPVSIPGTAAAKAAMILREQIDDLILAGYSVELPFEI